MSQKIEVKKDIEWLKKEIGNMPYTRLKRVGMEDYVAISKSGVFELINQLDKREVLSQEWIKGHEQQVHPDHPSNAWWVPADDLQNLLVPKQELPVIPKFVAEWIEFKKKSEVSYENVLQAIDELVKSRTSKAHNWVLKTNENKDTFARAWLDGYEIEKEPKYEKVLRVGEMFFRGGGYKDDVFVLELSDSRNAHVFVDEGEAINIQSSIGGQLEELEE